MSFTINKKEIKNFGSPFIIAEAGINHNGELEKAFEMIKVAKDSGADAVKFQTFKAEEFVNDENQMFTYKSQGKEVTESMLKMFKRYEFTPEEWQKIKKKCDEIGILFLSTPQNKSDLDFLLTLNIPAVKVGSDDFTNLPLLRSYAQTNLPMIISCGMSDLSEAYRALETIGAFEGHPVCLLLCTSQYPTPPEDVNLFKIKTLSQAFPMVPIGFSDHSQGPLASSVAVALGACVFEKHFTLDHDLPGPDHWFSENPHNLKLWIQSIRQAHTMLGNSLVRPTKNEFANKKNFQRCLVSASDIKAGEIFSEKNLTLRRIPEGKGLPPFFFDYFIGQKSCYNYKKGDPIHL